MGLVKFLKHPYMYVPYAVLGIYVVNMPFIEARKRSNARHAAYVCLNDLPSRSQKTLSKEDPEMKP